MDVAALSSAHYDPQSYWPLAQNGNNDSLCFVASERMETDFAYTCTATEIARLSERMGARSFRYLFSRHTANSSLRNCNQPPIRSCVTGSWMSVPPPGHCPGST